MSKTLVSPQNELKFFSKMFLTTAMLHSKRWYETARKIADFSFSIGLLAGEDGAISDVVPGTAAALAGIGPGMKGMAVNGRRFSLQVLREVLRAAKLSRELIDLAIENGELTQSYQLDYHDGERFPRLERDPSKPDLLEQIIKPKT